MKFYSLNNPNLRASFQEAVFNGLAPDNSLYMPVEFPKLDQHFFKDLKNKSFQAMSFEIAQAWIGTEIPKDRLKDIVEDAMNFPVPLHILDEETAMLELFHGPSMAFKDFGARFMSRVMGYFSQESSQPLDILVATSGDTGGAVALGFLDVPGVRVTILYPRGKVSALQEKQICGLGRNIRAFEVDGTFDDCQDMVKKAFVDPELKHSFRMSSANSINISRLIPQSFYYFYAYAQAQNRGFDRVAFSVPSGNFGNLAAGIMAWKMGLPVEQFISATNRNDTVPRFLDKGIFEARPSIQTISNAMDVGNPSNWPRIMRIFKEDTTKLKDQLQAYAYSDIQTRDAIEVLQARYGYLACPHSSIAWLGTQEYQKAQVLRIAVATAHACKFPEVYPAELAAKIQIPEGKGLSGDVPLQKHGISNTYTDFKDLFKKLA